MRRQPAVWLLAALLAPFIWACVSPLRYPSREKLLDLGGSTPVPASVRLTLGVQDVLLLRNGGKTAQVFGQLKVLPGHAVRLPFEQAGEEDFACSAHPRGAVQVQVVVPPDPGLARLRWRIEGLVDTVRHLPVMAPAH